MRLVGPLVLREHGHQTFPTPTQIFKSCRTNITRCLMTLWIRQIPVSLLSDLCMNVFLSSSTFVYCSSSNFIIFPYHYPIFHIVQCTSEPNPSFHCICVSLYSIFPSAYAVYTVTSISISHSLFIRLHVLLPLPRYSIRAYCMIQFHVSFGIQ